MKNLTRTAVLAAAIALSGCSNNEEAAREYFDKGMQWYEAGDWAKARVEFGNAIQKNPQYSDAYYYRALVAQKEENVPLMYENLAIATKLDATNFEAAVKLAELQMVTNEFEEAVKTADAILAQDPSHYNALRMRGAALLGLKKFDEAEAIYDDLLARNPKDASVLSLKSVILRERGQISEALQYLDNAIQVAENKVQYRLVRVALNKQRGDWNAVEQDMQAMVDENPEDLNYSYSLARYYLERNRNDAAEAVLKELITRYPERRAPRKYLVEAQLASDQQRGMETLNRFISRYPNDYELQFLKVQKQLQNKQQNAALNDLKNIIANTQFPQEVRMHGRTVLAEQYFAGGDSAAAMTLINQNIAIDDADEASLLLLAEQDLKKGEYATALSKLNSVLRRRPESEKALLMLGQVYVATGSPLLADDSYRQVLEVNPSNAEAAIPVVRSLMQSDDLERSENMMTEMLRYHPNDVRIQSLLANILLAKKRWQKAESLISEIRKNPTQQVYADFLQARLFQGRQHYDSAISAFAQVLEKKPEMTRALEGIAQCYLAQGDEQGFIDYVEQYSKANPTSYQAHVLLARYYQSQEKYSLAVKQIEKALTIDPSWLRGYASLAGYKTQMGDIRGAIKSFEKGIAFNKDDAFLKLLLADYYVQQKQYDKADEQYRELLKAAPNYAPALNNYANLLLMGEPTTEQKQQALSYAEKLKDTQEASFLDTYGWALFNVQDNVNSERYLRQAANLNPESPTILYHHARALQQLERFQEAHQLLQRAKKNLGSNDAELQKNIELAIAKLPESNADS